MIEASQQFLLFALIAPLLLAIFVKQINHSAALLASLSIIIFATIINFNSTISLPNVFYGMTFKVDIEAVAMILMISIIWLLNLNQFRRAGVSISTLSSKEMRLNLLLLFSSICTSLVTDLISFYCFSLLVSYSFYGLLVSQSQSMRRLRAARQCLILIILSDLILFDALLLANQALENSRPLSFLENRETLSEAFSFLVIIGFMLKAAIFPFGGWLWSILSNQSQPRFLPLMTIPLALFGITRWLPFGKAEQANVGSLFVLISLLTLMFYFILVLQKNNTNKRFQASGYCLISACFGLFAVSILNPQFWNDNGDYILVFIAFIGVFLSYLLCRNKTNVSVLNEHPQLVLSRTRLYAKWLKLKCRKSAARMSKLMTSILTKAKKSVKNNQNSIMQFKFSVNFQQRLILLIVVLLIFLIIQR